MPDNLHRYDMARAEYANGDKNFALSVLDDLARQKFPPALVFLGRHFQKLSQTQDVSFLDDARSAFCQAASKGNVFGKIFYAKLKHQDGGFFDTILLVLKMTIFSFEGLVISFLSNFIPRLKVRSYY